MREIKFRAWDKVNKKVRKVMSLDFYNTRQSEVTLASDGDVYFRYFEQVELMQYTCLKDKNGKEIYEGDIVDCFAGEYRHGIWEYQNRFAIEFGWTQSMWEMLHYDDIEVLGNIFENPELIQQQDQEEARND